MKLKVKNIGRIHDSNTIEINGITILCGENGTGKSTIGKALYCTFKTFHNYEEQIANERVNSIFRSVRLHNPDVFTTRNLNHLRKKIKELVNQYQIQKDVEIIDRHVKGFLDTNQEYDPILFDRIKDALNAEDSDVLQAILLRNINAEFNSQIGHINYSEDNSELELSIKDEIIRYSINTNGKVIIDEMIRLIKDIVYIDDPFILDEMAYWHYGRSVGHRFNLINKLTYRSDDFSAVDDVIAGNKLESVFSKLERLGIGNLEEDADSGFVYAEKGLRKGVSIVNTSTGIKSFVIIKSLLQKGFLEENGIVILDEPETHLNPEGMVEYAEIVVMLQAILGINFVISTHSSEFISYIEYFTKKYKIYNRTKFYLLKKNTQDMTTDIEDISDNLECIYSKLSRPFLMISEELDSLDEA